MDALPDSFDVIVIGTGMPECIVAAAAARVGKSVLHLDRNGYYGGDWASFNFDQFLEWIEEKSASQQNNENADLTFPELLNEGETLFSCNSMSKTITNIIKKSYIKEFPDPPIPETSMNNQRQDDVSSDVNSPLLIDEDRNINNNSSNVSSPTINANEIENENETNNSNNDVETPEASGTNQMLENASNVQHPEENRDFHHEWTISGFRENRRKFNFDLAPKLLFSRGSLVELLISSNIARYAEFQCINRVLTYINGHIEQVPCSRADVFSTKNVTVVEKRMLMKLLTFCMNYEDSPEEYNGFEDRPFIEFLHSRKLTSNLEHYILHAIAMVNESCSTLQGLASTKKFMQSLGRYGNSPFLWTCYGSAELPQCFCRLCAVFGGIYYLKRKAEAIIISDRCNGIISLGQRINCQWLIMESSYAPEQFMPQQNIHLISRAIFITDASILPSERQQNTLLRLPPSKERHNSITVLEFGSKSYVCPEELYIVYMFCQSYKTSAEEDLEPAAQLLFKSGNLDQDTNASKPNILWCLYYNQVDTSSLDLNISLPNGLLLTSSPDANLDYENAVKQAKEIFQKMYPGEEFLPRAPDPEDIILENHSNPGENSTKIENDVTDNNSDNNSSNNNEIYSSIHENTSQESNERIIDDK